MIPETEALREAAMVGEDRWREIRRLAKDEQQSVAAIGRLLDLDRKTVRRCLRQVTWQPYTRPARQDTLLAAHADFLRTRAPAVSYSARILYQELRRTRGYAGSYDTVKLFVRPLRPAEIGAARATARFETPPGLQSQIDWGQARVLLGGALVVRHVFVLTLGFSRRGFYEPCLDETLPQFLEAHERAFDHFGGHTREHLYDRPRTVCRPSGDGHVSWNPTFKAFASFWGFEPRVCRPYRARTKGKVESGVKYFRRNFLPGRTFRDDEDLREQLTAWMAEIADVRVHGTTHERPLDRFREEGPILMPTTGHPTFRLEATLPRVVATDYLVTVGTNRYSVPFTLIGETVTVTRRAGQLLFAHHGQLVAAHREADGRFEVHVLPEHGPGASARTTRQRRSTPGLPTLAAYPDVERRDLATYDALCEIGGVL
jgi:transposase